MVSVKLLGGSRVVCRQAVLAIDLRGRTGVSAWSVLSTRRALQRVRTFPVTLWSTCEALQPRADSLTQGVTPCPFDGFGMYFYQSNHAAYPTWFLPNLTFLVPNARAEL